MQKKRGTQQREKKHLSAVGLLSEVRKVFKKIPSTRSRNKKVSLADSLMSALAMFSLKSPSLLVFDKAYKNPGIIVTTQPPHDYRSYVLGG